MNHSEDDMYQDGIKLPTSDKDALNRHITACRLLGEAEGMLNGLSWQIPADETHKAHVLAMIERWSEKVRQFVEMEENE